jgi:hypothetical protein
VELLSQTFQACGSEVPTDRCAVFKCPKVCGFDCPPRLSRVVFVSDRGMVTTANLTALREKRIDWITALKAPQVKALNAAGALPLSLFDDRNLAEIEHADYPDERLIVCRNPLLADERGRKRDALLRATEAKLQPIRERVERGTLHGKAKIGLAVGAVRDKYKMSKHIELEIDDAKFTFLRKEAQIAEEASLDGIYIYILRTTVDAQFSTGDVVRSYKELAKVERAFRTMKSDDLAIRPIHHRLEDRAHTSSCVCSFIIWNGICAKPGRRYCLPTRIHRSPKIPLRRRRGRRRQSGRHAHGKPSSATKRTRSGHCWITWPAKCALR